MKYLSGLLIILAFSLLTAEEEKPSVTMDKASLRPLSANEILRILLKFPEMVPSMFKDEVLIKKDTHRLKRLFRLSELEDSLLKQLFPTGRFYQGWAGKKPRHPCLMAVVGNKRYSMPSGFNHLLLEHNFEVNQKNIIELAKAFVIIALEGHEVTFKDIKKSKRKINKDIIYWVHLNIQINDQKQIYGCRFEKGQMQWATMNIEGGTTTKYFDLEIIENSLNRK